MTGMPCLTRAMPSCGQNSFVFGAARCAHRETGSCGVRRPAASDPLGAMAIRDAAQALGIEARAGCTGRSEVVVMTSAGPACRSGTASRRWRGRTTAPVLSTLRDLVIGRGLDLEDVVSTSSRASSANALFAVAAVTRLNLDDQTVVVVDGGAGRLGGLGGSGWRVGPGGCGGVRRRCGGRGLRCGGGRQRTTAVRSCSARRPAAARRAGRRWARTSGGTAWRCRGR